MVRRVRRRKRRVDFLTGIRRRGLVLGQEGEKKKEKGRFLGRH